MSEDEVEAEVDLEHLTDEGLRAQVVAMAARLGAGEPGYRWVSGKTLPDGSIMMPWVHYEDWLWNGIWCGITLLCDRRHADWRPYYEGLSSQAAAGIPSAGFDELGAWFTLFGNKERFIEGLIAGGVDDGAILAMAERFLELIPAPDLGEPAPASNWRLRLGDVLTAAGINAADVLAIRHTYRPDGLVSPALATPSTVLEYTRIQGLAQSKVPADPPRWWLIFMAEGGRQSRLAYVYENRGLVGVDPAKNERVFDLVPSDMLSRVQGQLVIEWSKDAVNWAKTGAQAARFEVIELADRAAVPFPGFDDVLVDFATLQRMVAEPQYVAWRVALASVKGIYLVADTVDGQLYVGKADGPEGVLGRWRAYVGDGHGGNVEMLAHVQQDATHPHRYQFSLLQVFSPTTIPAEIDRAEEHWKRALLSRVFGMNQN